MAHMAAMVLFPMYFLKSFAYAGVATVAFGAAAALVVTPAAIWLLGIVLYHLLAPWAPQFGSALPTLAATFVLGALSARTGTRAMQPA